MCVQPDFGGQRFALRQDVRQLGRDSVDARAAGSLRYQITPILD